MEQVTPQSGRSTESKSRLSWLEKKLVPSRWSSKRGEASRPRGVLNPGDIPWRVNGATPDDNWQNAQDKFHAVAELTHLGLEETRKVIFEIETRLSSTGKWRVTFKALQLLDYLLHNGSRSVLSVLLINLDALESIVPGYFGEPVKHTTRIRDQMNMITWLIEDEARIEAERQDPNLLWVERVMAMPAEPEQWQLLDERYSSYSYPPVEDDGYTPISWDPELWADTEHGTTELPSHHVHTNPYGEYNPPQPATMAYPNTTDLPSIRLNPSPGFGTTEVKWPDEHPTKPLSQNIYEQRYTGVNNSAGHDLEQERLRQNQRRMGAASDGPDNLVTMNLVDPQQYHSSEPKQSSNSNLKATSKTKTQDAQWHALHKQTLKEILTESYKMLDSAEQVKTFVLQHSADLIFKTLQAERIWSSMVHKLSLDSAEHYQNAMRGLKLHKSVDTNDSAVDRNFALSSTLEPAKYELDRLYRQISRALQDIGNTLYFGDPKREKAWKKVFAGRKMTLFDLETSAEVLLRALQQDESQQEPIRNSGGLERVFELASGIREVSSSFKHLLGESEEISAPIGMEIPSFSSNVNIAVQDPDFFESLNQERVQVQDFGRESQPATVPSISAAPLSTSSALPSVSIASISKAPANAQSSFSSKNESDSGYGGSMIHPQNQWQNLFRACHSFTTDEELYKYINLFTEIFETCDKTLSFAQFSQLMSKTGLGLGEQVINQIWTLAVEQQSSEMYFPEFTYAMQMSSLAIQGNILPKKMPESLRAEIAQAVAPFRRGASRASLNGDKNPFRQQSPNHPATLPLDVTENNGFPNSINKHQLTVKGENLHKNLWATSHVEAGQVEVSPIPAEPVSPNTQPGSQTRHIPTPANVLPTHPPKGKSPTPSLKSKSSRLVSDLVRDSKLETIFYDKMEVVRHISYVSNPRQRQRRTRKDQTWSRRQELGTGAFGRVWLEERLDAEDAGRLRAVKEIAKTQPQEKSKEIDFNRELEAIAKFSHSKYVHCFVQSFGWYENEDKIYIAMEYMEKGDLQSYLTKPFPEDEVKQVIFQILEGLGFMHENGFAHRDLKPANILVSEPSPNWWVKISDFGISKRAEEEATAFRTLVGTRGYLAPEVMGIFSPEDMARNDLSMDSSTLYTVAVDLWALGAIMFRLLTNEDIFADPRQLAKYVIAKQPFPAEAASKLGANDTCIVFLKEVMGRSPNDRPSASRALEHAWLSDMNEPMEPPDDLMEQLSISTGTPAPHTMSALGTNQSLASAQWPTRFE